MIRKGFIINPYYELIPDYKICPFTNKDILKNRSLPKSNAIDDYFSLRFNHQKYTYTLNGREAIHLALKSYNLNPTDIVTIYTTSGNHYISGCVTREIEKFCKWSREIGEKTKLIFVNHEFGYPYTGIQELKKYHLPIIEDCAHSFFLTDKDDTIGKIGDYTIYSFPKIFPIQIGGLLVSNLDNILLETKVLGKTEKRYIQNVLSHYIKEKEEIVRRRLDNYSFLVQEFNKLGLIERFAFSKDVIPGVFMFRKGNNQIMLPELKKYFYAHGVQCSVFYGEESFFLPVHQNIEKNELVYFVEIIKTFLK